MYKVVSSHFKKYWKIYLIITVIVIALGLGLGLGLNSDSSSSNTPQSPTPTPVFNAYGQKGIREDGVDPLWDVIPTRENLGGWLLTGAILDGPVGEFWDGKTEISPDTGIDFFAYILANFPGYGIAKAGITIPGGVVIKIPYDTEINRDFYKYLASKSIVEEGVTDLGDYNFDWTTVKHRVINNITSLRKTAFEESLTAFGLPQTAEGVLTSFQTAGESSDENAQQRTLVDALKDQQFGDVSIEISLFSDRLTASSPLVQGPLAALGEIEQSPRTEAAQKLGIILGYSIFDITDPVSGTPLLQQGNLDLTGDVTFFIVIFNQALSILKDDGLDQNVKDAFNQNLDRAATISGILDSVQLALQNSTQQINQEDDDSNTLVETFSSYDAAAIDIIEKFVPLGTDIRTAEVNGVTWEDAVLGKTLDQCLDLWLNYAGQLTDVTDPEDTFQKGKSFIEAQREQFLNTITTNPDDSTVQNLFKQIRGLILGTYFVQIIDYKDTLGKLILDPLTGAANTEDTVGDNPLDDIDVNAETLDTFLILSALFDEPVKDKENITKEVIRDWLLNLLKITLEVGQSMSGENPFEIDTGLNAFGTITLPSIEENPSFYKDAIDKIFTYQVPLTSEDSADTFSFKELPPFQFHWRSLVAACKTSVTEKRKTESEELSKELSLDQPYNTETGLELLQKTTARAITPRIFLAVIQTLLDRIRDPGADEVVIGSSTNPENITIPFSGLLENLTLKPLAESFLETLAGQTFSNPEYALDQKIGIITLYGLAALPDTSLLEVPNNTKLVDGPYVLGGDAITILASIITFADLIITRDSLDTITGVTEAADEALDSIKMAGSVSELRNITQQYYFNTVFTNTDPAYQLNVTEDNLLEKINNGQLVELLRSLYLPVGDDLTALTVEPDSDYSDTGDTLISFLGKETTDMGGDVVMDTKLDTLLDNYWNKIKGRLTFGGGTFIEARNLVRTLFIRYTELKNSKATGVPEAFNTLSDLFKRFTGGSLYFLLFDYNDTLGRLQSFPVGKSIIPYLEKNTII